MQNLKALLLIFLIGAGSIFKLSAQAGMEDVIYLKNGNIYRGLIIEQVPNVSMKIQTIGGNVFSVEVADVTKITKEAKAGEERGYQGFGQGMHPWHMKDSTRHSYKIKKKGYFFQGQILIENLQGGVRIINGYKFNRFAYLGIGIGFDHVFSAPYVRSNMPLNKNAYSGFYFPLYLFYSGDILAKRITPFYAIEGGYAMGPFNRNNNVGPDFGGRNMRGGAMGSAGLGVKFFGKHGGNFSILLNMNFKQTRFEDNKFFVDEFGNSYNFSQRTNAFLLFPGLRLGLGF